ncbi:MAG: molybdate ABC transporter substrate-binding protein [Polyangiales bacterium]
MRRGPGLVVMLGSLVLALTGACRRPPERVLVVDAAASTTEALGEAAKIYERTRGVPVRLSFGASSELAREIEAGAPVDVFLSADVAKMDRLAGAGLVRPEDRRDLLSNVLVVVVPRGSTTTVTGAHDLGRLARIATGETSSVPIGIYARGWLERAGAWAEVAPRLVATVDVRGALAAVESESVDAAIVYRTDALASPKVRVAVTVPSPDAPSIPSPVARLTSAPCPGRARDFVEFLGGPEARAAFERRGFVVAP